MRTIASLIRSAAVPCSGVLTAVRSANPRELGLRLFMSGMGRSRPNSVRVTPVCAHLGDGLVDESLHPRVAREIVVDVLLRLVARDAERLREAERAHAIDDAEVDDFGLAPRLGRHHQRRHVHHFRRRARVDVFAAAEGLDQHRIARHVREQPQLDLRIIRHHHFPARPRHEGGADLAAQFRLDGDVLQVRVRRREPAGGRAGLVEAGVQPAGARIDSAGSAST